MEEQSDRQQNSSIHINVPELQAADEKKTSRDQKIVKVVDFRKMNHTSPWKLRFQKKMMENIEEESLKALKEKLNEEKDSRAKFALPVLITPGPGEYNVSGNMLKKSKNAKAGLKYKPFKLVSHQLQTKHTLSKSNSRTLEPMMISPSSPSLHDNLGGSRSKMASQTEVTAPILVPMPDHNNETLIGRNKLFDRLLGPQNKSQRALSTVESKKSVKLPRDLSQNISARPKEIKLVKLSKQNLDNISSVVDSRARIKSKVLADMANQYTIHKHFLGQYQKLK